MKNFDVIVVGCGGMGSSALFELARRGQRVLGLEQFSLVHDHGSSHGQTRVIRTAYYEHPDYVPILHRAWNLWYELEQFTGRQLLTECGCQSIGPSQGELILGVKSSAAHHQLEIHPHSGEPFRLPDGYEAVFESQAGYLKVEDCVRAYLDQAIVFGAEIHENETVIDWQANGNSVIVRTKIREYHAAKVVVTAGAWATRLLLSIGIPLTVMRQVMLWFEPKEPERFRRDRFPVFLFESRRGAFYGLPQIDERGVKIARHYCAPELRHPEEISFETIEADETPVWDFIRESIDASFVRCRARQACMYTLTPDRHFVLDFHPGNANVVVAAGFSGHGFKFASVVGEVLADLVEQGQTHHPIGRFRISGRSSKV